VEQAVRKSRIPSIIPPPPTGHDDNHETTVLPRSPACEIPGAQLARMRALVKYGMTIAQVAAVYGVAVGDIQHIFGRKPLLPAVQVNNARRLIDRGADPRTVARSFGVGRSTLYRNIAKLTE
jgi:hypothetical protein